MKRIYIVSYQDTRTLVRAVNRQQARAMVARTMIGVELASQDALIEMIQNGAKVVEGPEDVVDAEGDDE